MRRQTTDKGFTIIEVVLFLALSTFMIIIAAASIGGRTRTVQFTDTVRSLESFFQRRLALVEAGSLVGDTANCRWTGAAYNFGGGSDGSCVFLGYIFEFGDVNNPASTNPARDEINVHQIFGRRLTSTDIENCPTPTEPLNCAHPIRSPQTPVETFSIPWGGDITHSLSTDGAEAITMKAFGYLKNPAGNAIIPIAIDRTIDLLAELDDESSSMYLASNALTRVDNEFSEAICVFDDDIRAAKISFGSDNSKESLAVDFVPSNNVASIGCDIN